MGGEGSSPPQNPKPTREAMGGGLNSSERLTTRVVAGKLLSTKQISFLFFLFLYVLSFDILHRYSSEAYLIVRDSKEEPLSAARRPCAAFVLSGSFCFSFLS